MGKAVIVSDPQGPFLPSMLIEPIPFLFLLVKHGAPTDVLGHEMTLKWRTFDNEISVVRSAIGKKNLENYSSPILIISRLLKVREKQTILS